MEGLLIDERHRLARRIAVDGLGEVWEATTNRPTPRSVRVRFWRLPEGLSEEQHHRLRARLVEDAMRVHQLRHRAFMPIYSYGQRDGVPFLIMEGLNGLRLSDWVQRCGKASPEQAVEVALVLLDALAQAHAVGLVDGTLNADRLFVQHMESSRRLRLPDFGLASAETLLGPSSARHPTDDLRGVGDVMFHMLVGCTTGDLAPHDTPGERLEGISVGRYLREANPRFVKMIDRARAGGFSSAERLTEELTYTRYGLSLNSKTKPAIHQLTTIPPP